ncbi:ThiF family adenylyltransferase [Photobacterium kasasachensis]|uniref:ThiF family adenylyltransferase n=1 Tax=Photobacterium kasasachensis TaxID=2910240 RepID=UPI003D14F78D
MSDYFPCHEDKIEEDEVKLNGSTSMVKAIKRDQCADLIDIRVKKIEGKSFEYIIVDIYNDEIPSRNKTGIKYCERISYVFTEGEVTPLTLAMRKDFPVTMHQDAIAPEQPKSLCLYVDPKDVVDAYWTAERHIKRTRWWLKKAAMGELHPDDQALEQLFYNSSSTIVLPHDYDSNSKHGRTLIAVAHTNEEKKTNDIFIVTKWKGQGFKNGGVEINIVDVLTEPVTHGVINQTPRKVAELASLLEPLAVDLVTLIRQRLLSLLRANDFQLDIAATVFVVKFPLRRSDNKQAESYQTIAFYCNKSLVELMRLFEVVLEGSLEERTDFDHKLFPMSTNEVDLNIEFIECLRESSSKERRIQSGVQKPFGKGVIVGAGALGGALVDLWVKAGWGAWTVVDNDIFRPHNFTRHVIPTWATGLNKAQVVAGHYSSQFKGSNVKWIDADATNFTHPQLKQCLSEAEIVVDASASLSYPRAVSGVRNAPRHASVFFSPSGNGAVLLVEDRRRNVRLSSLEAQYYRALIHEAIGATHLTSVTDQFRSGASCRDNSFVMAHSRVMACSSLLSEQVIQACEQGSAKIMIWQDNEETGDRISFQPIVRRVKTSNNHSLNQFKVYWDEGIEDRVKKYRKESLPNETGGILIGYHDMIQRCVFIVDALPAPSDSEGTATTFQRGTNGVVESLNRIVKRTANNVGYIGEWHSHPKGASVKMSSLDKIQLRELAESLSRDGLPAYQMIVGEREIKVYEKVFGDE